MSKENEKLKNYADGWIQERNGTDVPAFLKIAFPIIGLSCTAYLVLYMVGEVDHTDRGSLVRAFNAATETSPALMYIVTALSLIYVIIVAMFAFRKVKED